MNSIASMDSSSTAKPRTFLLVDAHAIIYRAYHAFPELTAPDGTQVNALYGFARLLLRSVADFGPEYVALSFDHPEPTFRHQDFADYKAHREKMPDDLQSQIPLIKDLVDILNMPRFEIAGFEADDLVGTLAAQSRPLMPTSLDRVVILTGDSDLLQLVDDGVRVFLPRRGKFGQDKLYDPLAVEEKYGLPPGDLPQLKALTGDSSDNIPGVPGIGPKTALKILQAVGSIDNLYHLLAISREDSDQGRAAAKLLGQFSKRIVGLLESHEQQARTSLGLATINTAAPIDLELDACRLQSYDKDRAVAMFERLAFDSLVRLLPEDELEAGIQSALF